jgi:hypothetical protein
MKVISYIILSLLLLGAARGQEFILYKLESKETPYVFSKHSFVKDTYETFEVTLAKAISAKSHGFQIELTLSNVTILRTEVPFGVHSNTLSNVKQTITTAKSLTMNFNKTDKMIFEGKIIEIGNYGAEKPQLPKIEYEGEAAKRYLNEHGLEEPPGK